MSRRKKNTTLEGSSSKGDQYPNHNGCRPSRWNLHEQPAIPGFATWELDLKNEVCRYSPEWASIIGSDDFVHEERWNWAWWSGRMHVDDMVAVRELEIPVIMGLINEQELMYRFRRPDGRWLRLLSRGKVILRGDDGTPELITGIIIDISHLPNAAMLATPLEQTPHDDAGRANTFAMPWNARADRRALLNERRLNALHLLSQMETASENMLAHFALSSIMHLTDSVSSFIFFPEADLFGDGRMFWSRDHLLELDKKFLPDSFLPKELHPLLVNQSGTPISRFIQNGEGESPLIFLYGGKIAVKRYLLCSITENDRVVCIAGIRDKGSDYDSSDMQQVETFLKSTWLIIRRHRLFLELQSAKEAAENANKAKNEFIASVSHELRTPLNGILGMLQLLEEMPMPLRQRELVCSALSSGKDLVRIISDTLDFSRIELGKMRLFQEPFDLKGSLLSSLRLFQEGATKKNLKFDIAIDEAIPDVLVGDEARIHQIMFNLVGNSLKFTESGGISVRCELEEQSNGGKVRLTFSVSDTGIGIPLEKQEKIFGAFIQADNSSTKKYPGLGLGLSIVKSLVSFMDGTVKLESEVGTGTTVTCTLVLDAAREGLPEISGESASPHAFRSLNILVAEDDAVGRFAINSFLQRAGHRAVCVNDGREALEALQLYPFDCLFTDIQMPHMDGVELAQRIRANDLSGISPTEAVRSLVRAAFPEASGDAVFIAPDCLMVAVSAHAMEGDKAKLLNQGIDYYIAKPIVVKELSELLQLIAARISKQPENTEQ